MATSIKDLADTADRILTPDARADLAHVMETFIRQRRQNSATDFTAAELAALRSWAAEPFDPADDAAVAALFARHDT